MTTMISFALFGTKLTFLIQLGYAQRMLSNSIRDEFRLYEFLMSLHKDFEPIRGHLLNCSPAPSLDTAMNELVREEARRATLQAQNKLSVWLLLLLLHS